MLLTPSEILSKVPPIRTPGSIAGLREMMKHVPAGAVIAEVGCYAGESTEVLSSKASKVFAVDTWDPDLFPYCPQGVTMRDVDMAFRVRMAPWREALEQAGGNLIVCRMTSKSASDYFRLGNHTRADAGETLVQFDLVYIDADHFYPSVCADIRGWIGLVKDGGWIGGHDYNDEQWRPEVNRAVDELLGKPDLTFPDCSWLKRVTPELKAAVLGARP